MTPFPPLFPTAVVFGGLIRLLEIWILASSTREFFVFQWQSDCGGPFSLSSGILAICILFFAASLFQAISEPRKKAHRATLCFCLILVVYGYGIHHYTARMASEMIQSR